MRTHHQSPADDVVVADERDHAVADVHPCLARHVGVDVAQVSDVPAL